MNVGVPPTRQQEEDEGRESESVEIEGENGCLEGELGVSNEKN